MMRIGVDLDGTLTEGKYVAAPEDPRAYLDLAPYDHDTAELWNHFTRVHHVTLITARSHYDALGLIRTWLLSNFMRLPSSIVTGVEPAAKGAILRAMGCTHFFDDAPKAFAGGQASGLESYLVHNEGWAENRDFETAKRVRSWAEIRNILEAA